MSLSLWMRSARFRRAIAVSSVVLATGGLVLYKAPLSSAYPSDAPHLTRQPLVANGKNSVAFSGPGAHGVLAFSHTKVLSGQSTPVYAELRLLADSPLDDAKRVRAPISMAVVLDTSGSMSGEKIEEAKRSVLRLVGDMRDDDEIALVRYDDRSELIQPLAKVGSVRSSLAMRVRAIEAGGGTNIPGGLSHGLRAIDEAAKGRVRRIVLVSDGLDNTRAQAEALARSSFSSGISVSSLGIGLDFDESYMGSLARNGHGNFAFVKDGASLASFLKRELEETSTTTIENAQARIKLPTGVRFVSAHGADARMDGDELVLSMGSLFAGDERRVIVELSASTTTNLGNYDFGAKASWTNVGETYARNIDVPRLSILATNDANEVDVGRDGAVLASATSVLASERQIQAAQAYAVGDVSRAAALADQNQAALADALANAPAAAAPAIKAQMGAYEEQKRGFTTVSPMSVAGKSHAKAAAAKEMSNMNRQTY
jgi:Ca-activated chloride channel family protein